MSGEDRGSLEFGDGVPLFYNELRQLAAHYLRAERPGHTLQPTALVHEAYLRLAKLDEARWSNRAQFFATAAGMMRRILVSHARSHNAQKRSATTIPFPSGQSDPESAALDVITVDALLTRLESVHPEASRALELRFFGGLTDTEAAAQLGVSRATIQRHLEFGKAWIYRELNPA